MCHFRRPVEAQNVSHRRVNHIPSCFAGLRLDWEVLQTVFISILWLLRQLYLCHAFDFRKQILAPECGLMSIHSRLDRSVRILSSLWLLDRRNLGSLALVERFHNRQVRNYKHGSRHLRGDKRFHTRLRVRHIW